MSKMNDDNKCINICIVDNCVGQSNWGPRIYTPLAKGIFIYKTPSVHVFMVGTNIQLSGPNGYFYVICLGWTFLY